MAEEVQYSSGTNKTKQTRWGTGFSAPPDSYNNVLPLGAQEVAARIVNTADNGVKVGAGVSIPMISTTFRETSKKIYIACGSIDVIIGKVGKTIRYLQLGRLSLWVHQIKWPRLSNGYRIDVLAEAESGGSGIVSRRVTPGQPGYDRFLMQIPSNKVLGFHPTGVALIC
ncbi:hypothetical protein RHGRI_000880 [Rhododendron griersonianum]|uniref:K Homology domain-containing protein n=1 Tax=Rhododendron griersonianum TaxID=479676 RepID=A0AAV6LJ58_9ERIC|nr:hypothetical protein RHGRI_000880 [Rhododendron griersonianum]